MKKLCFLFFFAFLACKNNSTPEGFVNLEDSVPSLVIELRYSTTDNFVGEIIDGYRDPAMMGVWVDGKKICSIGLAFLHWVSRHGLALNYATPGNRIENLACCGLDIGTTTSLEKLGYTTNNDGEKITKKLLEDTLISNIEEILNRIPVEGAYKFEDFL